MSDTRAQTHGPAQRAHPSESLRTPPARAEDELAILISPTYEILMMHPGLEKWWKRKAATFLGKKCYEEMEKRSSPCPHCPGAEALRTGRVAEGEGTATLDDGTKVPFHLRAYPIAAADGRPAGWVEVVESIAARKEEEEYGRFQVGLMNALLDTSSMSTVLRLGLDAALRLQGAESGCAYEVDMLAGVADALIHRGLLETELAGLEPDLGDLDLSVTDRESYVQLTLPVVFRERTLARLVLRLTKDAQVHTSVRARLEALACILASATARLHADRLRGDCGANVSTILDKGNEPILWIDDFGRVTSWNHACEHQFGWSDTETLGRPLPFAEHNLAGFLGAVRASADSGAQSFTFRCRRREASPINQRFKAAPLHDVIGDGSAYAVFALAPSSSQGGQGGLRSGREARPVPEQTHIELANRILAWIDRSRVTDFSRSDCYQALRRTRGVDSPADIDASLDLLVCWGRISARPPSPRARTGRPRSRSFTVDPCASE